MKEKKKKIALYGGSFDPPHYGHVFGIWSLLNSNDFDEIWVLPSGDRVDKPNSTNAELRLEMLDILINENFSKEKKVIVKDIQIANDNVPKTSYVLFNYLSEKYKNTDFYLAIGAELISELGSWKDTKELCEKVNFIIVPRLGIDPDTSKIKNFTILKTPKELDFNISSSVIRKLFQEKKDLSGIMPKSIIDFIKSKKLYE